MLRLCCTDRGHQKLSLFLLEEGADPNTADGNGITALHYLVLKGFAVLAAEPAHLGVNSHLYRPSIRRNYFSNWAPVPRSFPSCRQSTEPRVSDVIIPARKTGAAIVSNPSPDAGRRT